MSQVVEPRTDRSSSVSSGDANGVSRLKKLTSGSTWTSPFRTGNSKNLRKQYKEDNAITNVAVPKKFASHPILEESQKSANLKKKASTESEKKEELEDEEKEDDKEEEDKEDEDKEEDEEEEDKEEEEKEEEEENEEKEDEENQVKDEEKEEEVNADKDLEEKEKEAEDNDVADDEEVKEKEDENIKDVKSDDNIEEQVKEAPIELNVDPSSKYEPVPGPNDDIVKEFEDKPLLLSRYQELSAAAAATSAQFDNPSKVIDLGSGMKMTQQQLLDIAALRVAPILGNINEEVGKTRTEDDIKKQKELDTKVAAHEKKLGAEFDKYLKKLGKKKDKFTLEIQAKLEDLERLIKNSHNTAATFEKTTKGEIETANTEFSERELKAVEKHSTDKENLEKNHEELEATKKQELENAKAEQEAASEEISTLTEKKAELETSNAELATKLEELNSKVAEKKELAAKLKEQIEEKESLITENHGKKETMSKSIEDIKKTTQEKTTQHEALLAEVGALSATLASYSSKIDDLNNKKEENKSRLLHAKSKYEDWEAEKKSMAAQIAKEHEMKRIEALEAAETKKIEEEIERQRLEREAKAKEEEERLKKEQLEREEAERAEAEKAQREKEEAERAEHERLLKDPEYQRKLRLEKQEAERKEFLEKKAEEERLFQERKAKALEDERNLELEIEELRAQREEKARLEKLEADRLAEQKMDEINKLKDEYEQKLTLIKERLEYEEIQKSRIAEELENSKKIRMLKEERDQITEQTNKALLAQVKDIISSRDEEIKFLTSKVEMDDDELFRRLHKTDKPETNNDSFLVNSNELAEPTVKRAISKKEEPSLPKSKSGSLKKVVSKEHSSQPRRKSVAESTKSKEEHKHNGRRKSVAEVTESIIHGAANAMSGFATSGTAAAIPSATGLKNATTQHVREDPVYKPDVDRSGSNTWNKFKKKLNLKKEVSPDTKKKSKDGVNKVKPESAEAPAKSANTPAKSANTPTKSVGASKDDESEYETYSVYEEVSDSEYEKNHGHPDYLEVSSDEFDRLVSKKK